MKYQFVVVEGNIGAGKTTLVEKIAERYNAKAIFEGFSDNPFLPKFYENQERYAFPVELSFLAERYYQLKNELTNTDLFKSFTISDYYFMKSLIFAKATLQDDEFKLYRQLFQIIHSKLPKPDLIVYLHVDIEKLLWNIKLRGRAYEQDISGEYLKSIQDGYFTFWKEAEDLKIVVVDTNAIDFVSKNEDFEKLCNVIFEEEYSTRYNTVIP